MLEVWQRMAAGRGCIGPARPIGSVQQRRGFDQTAGNTFGLLHSEVLAVEGGWREARILDGDFFGWLCQHVHATAQEAENCREKESLLGPPSRPEDRLG